MERKARRRKGKKLYSCKFPDCENACYERDPGPTFYPFPKSRSMTYIWKTICKLDEDENVHNVVWLYRVCIDHFHENEIMRGKNKLRHFAFPKSDSELNDYDEYQESIADMQYERTSDENNVPSSLQTATTSPLNRPISPPCNEWILKSLKIKFSALPSFDKYCALIVNETTLTNSYYDHAKHKIVDYDYLEKADGIISKYPNNAVVFMLQGLSTPLKENQNIQEIVAYYFTVDLISTENLKGLILKVIDNLQKIGIKIVATVSNQKFNHKAALSQLCAENTSGPSSNIFKVNGQEIVIIYDVPHLLKDTRNALVQCDIHFHENKVAKFKYMVEAYNIFVQRDITYYVKKLRPQDFTFEDEHAKNSVKVAANQLSHSMAIMVDQLTRSKNSDFALSMDASDTASFAADMDKLFDSLNSKYATPIHYKVMKCALSKFSPHLEYWNGVLEQLQKWKLIEISTGTNVTSQYEFIEGWQTTIRSIIYLWEHLQKVGFCYLNFRTLNLDPLEKVFKQIQKNEKGYLNTIAFKRLMVTLPSSVEEDCCIQ